MGTVGSGRSELRTLEIGIGGCLLYTSPSGIRVNCIAPGAIATRMNDNLDEEAVALLREETPLGRMGTPEEIAKAIAFLALEDSAFTTGQVLSPNGGLVI